MPRKRPEGMPVKTTAEKLAAAMALVDKYTQQLSVEARVNDVEVGDAVSYKFGRADKVRVLVGSVTGIKGTPKGRLVAVLTGDGFDTTTNRVRIQDITENRTAAIRAASSASGNPLDAA